MKQFYLVLFLVGYSLISKAQTLADSPCSLPGPAQWTIDAPCANVSVTYSGFSDLLNPLGCGSGSGEPDGWAWFYGNGNNLDIDFQTSLNWPTMYLYEGTPSPGCAVNFVDCATSTGADLNINFNSTAGQLYFIMIQEQDGDAGWTVSGCLSVTNNVPPVLGCTDPLANNYNPLATVDDGSCTYNTGCTDPLATNYDPSAVVDDGSCIYPSADQTHPTSLVNDEYVGTCLVNDCGPFSYTDNGDFVGNYSNNIGTSYFDPWWGWINQGVYRVFCPETAGNCMQATFSNLSINADGDYLFVKNGPTQNSTIFTTPPANASGYLFGNHSNFTYTSTDDSGCLTFEFFSNGSGTSGGWTATLECVPCAAGPNGTDPNDCSRLIPLCSGQTVSGDASGPGLESEGCNGSACPTGGENHSIWYKIQAQTSGTIDITINPVDASDDYDFIVFGPNATCDNLGAPLRCSDAYLSGITGTNSSSTDISEDVWGDKYVQTINANAGESFIIVVDEWSPNASGTGFDLSFGGTADLDCAILPVELSKFDVLYQAVENAVDVSWVTNSEYNTDYFLLEKSTNGSDFESIFKLNAQGFTNYETHYLYVDSEPSPGVNYYRLKQYDRDGAYKYSEVRSVNILDDEHNLLSIFPNPTSSITEVIFNNYSSEDVEFIVKSVDGKPVLTDWIPSHPGANRFEFDSSNLSNGIYTVEIRTKHKTFVERFMKR